MAERLEPGNPMARKKDMFNRRYLKAIDLVNRNTGSGSVTIFDVFFGTGQQLSLYEEHLRRDLSVKVVGVDLNPEIGSHQIRDNLSLVMCQGNFLDARLQSMLREESCSSDKRAVISMESIEHVAPEYQQDFLARLYDLLQPGELMVLSTPNGRNTSKQVGTGRVSPNPYHMKELYFGELEEMVKKAGGVVDKVYCLGAGLGLVSRLFLNKVSDTEADQEKLQRAHYGSDLKQLMVSIADVQPFRHLLTRMHSKRLLETAICMYLVTRKKVFD